MSLKKWSLELPRKAFFISALAKALSLSPFVKSGIRRASTVHSAN